MNYEIISQVTTFLDHITITDLIKNIYNNSILFLFIDGIIFKKLKFNNLLMISNISEYKLYYQ